MICGRCGTDMREGARFCAKCGMKGETEITVVCPHCGMSYPSGSRFCTKDGTPLVEKSGYSPSSENRPAGLSTWPKAQGARKEKISVSLDPKKKKSKTWLVAFIIIVLVVGTGALLQYGEYFSGSPEKTTRVINESLRAKGLTVSVQVDGNWTATVVGTVKDQNEKSLALEELSRHKEIRQLVDRIVVKEAVVDLTEIKNRLSKVVDSLIEIKNCVNEYFMKNRQIQAALDVNEIGTKYGLKIQSTFALFSVDEKGGATATIKDVSPGVDGKTISVSPDDHFRTWTWGATVDQVYLPATVLISPDGSTGLSTNSDTTAKRGEPGEQTVKPHSDRGANDQAKNPASLKQEVANQIGRAGFSSVTVEVDGNLVVTLKGSVTGKAEKDRLMNLVRSNGRVEKIKDLVFTFGN